VSCWALLDLVGLENQASVHADPGILGSSGKALKQSRTRSRWQLCGNEISEGPLQETTPQLFRERKLLKTNKITLAFRTGLEPATP